MYSCVNTGYTSQACFTWAHIYGCHGNNKCIWPPCACYISSRLNVLLTKSRKKNIIATVIWCQAAGHQAGVFRSSSLKKRKHRERPPARTVDAFSDGCSRRHNKGRAATIHQSTFINVRKLCCCSECRSCFNHFSIRPHIYVHGKWISLMFRFWQQNYLDQEKILVMFTFGFENPHQAHDPQVFRLSLYFKAAWIIFSCESPHRHTMAVSQFRGCILQRTRQVLRRDLRRPCQPITRCLGKWWSTPRDIDIFFLHFFFFGHAKNPGICEARKEKILHTDTGANIHT